MKRCAFVFACLVMFAFPVKADTLIINGAEKAIPENSFAELSVTVFKGDLVGWQVFPRPIKLADNKDGKLYVSGKPGSTFTVLCTIVNFGKDEGSKQRFDQAEVTLTMAGKAPDVDPDVDPEATSPLLTELRSVFKYETDEDKAFAPGFAQMYADAASKYVDASETWGDLFDKMTQDVAGRKMTGKLTTTQRVIQKYLKDNLPWKGAAETPMDAAGKKKAKDAFKVVAAAFGKLK